MGGKVTEISPRMAIIRLHVERVSIELKIKFLREAILNEASGRNKAVEDTGRR